MLKQSVLAHSTFPDRVTMQWSVFGGQRALVSVPGTGKQSRGSPSWSATVSSKYSRKPCFFVVILGTLMLVHLIWLGALMSFAWGVLAPTGIFLALFYKIVWPDGQWFYVRKSNVCA